MKKFLFAAVLWLSFVASAFAQQITIDPKHHVENIHNKFCAHCCIETIARHYGRTDMVGYTNHLFETKGMDSGPINLLEVSKILTKNRFYNELVGIDTSDRDYRYAQLKWACEHQYPCITGIRNVFGKTGHALTIVGIDDTCVYVVNCNLPGEVRSYTRARFDELWFGIFVIVYPNEFEDCRGR